MPPPDAELNAPDGVLTWRGVVAGMRLAIPFALSSLVYGLAFGMLASEAGLSILEAVLMSVLVFSGTAQVAVLQTWAVMPGLLPVFLIVVIANVRYVLMGASLRPWLGDLPARKSALPLLFLVDGGFALGTRANAQGDRDAGVVLGACLLSYIWWCVGTLVGGVSGRMIANPKAIGLDFIVVAFCAASAALLAKSVKTYWPAAAALVAILVVEAMLPGPWVIVAAGLTAALVGAICYRPVNEAAPEITQEAAP